MGTKLCRICYQTIEQVDACYVFCTEYRFRGAVIVLVQSIPEKESRCPLISISSTSSIFFFFFSHSGKPDHRAEQSQIIGLTEDPTITNMSIWTCTLIEY